VRAGADRVVNPQLIGGRRMASFALQPHVAEFFDVVMHDQELDFGVEQVEIRSGSSVAGRRLGEAALGEQTGALILALRSGPDGRFVANPGPDTTLDEGVILIAVGQPDELEALRRHTAAGSARRQPT
jgi:voltage-gated potassium channel